MKTTLKLTAAACCLSSWASVHAAEWSDTSVSVRYGTTFAEPYDNNADGSRKDITKTIVGLTHASGFKYGTNFFNVDVLLSSGADPGNGTTAGAVEVYGVYRNMLDFGKISGANLQMGPIRGFGLTSGFDLNTKNDFYGSKKRMFVIGPTVQFDVPGFLNVSALLLDESNAPNNPNVGRYHYKNHVALEANWGGIQVASLPLTFKGYALWIASKGIDESGNQTKPETHLDAQLVLDVGAVAGGAKDTFTVALEYEFWKNKFGNDASGFAGPGAKASTPMIRAEYHF